MIQRLAESSPTIKARPLKVLALRAVDGAGGGADKIVLRNAQTVDPNRVEMATCFVHHPNDTEFDLVDRAVRLGIRSYEETHRGPFDLRIFRRIQNVVADFQPDIIHSHDYKASFITSRVARGANIRCLATSHGWTGEKWQEKHLFYPADRHLLRSFDGVIAVSDQIRDTLINAGVPSSRIRVVLNGIHSAEYQSSPEVREKIRAELGYQPQDIVLGGSGRIEVQKRFDLLIDAFARLHKRNPRLKLAIAGEGSLLEPLRQEVARRQLQDHCQLLGHRQNMVETYQAFDMLVQSSDYEGTPTVVVEAMALGIPIVATNAGGTAQLIHDEKHGRVVACRDIPALCDAVQACLDQPEATSQRVKAARLRVETDLSYTRRTQQLESIYLELMERGHLDARTQ